MTFLKKLGMIIAKIGMIAAGIGPIAAQAFPEEASQIGKVTDTLTLATQVVVNIEGISAALESPMSGEDKLRAASALVSNIVLQSDLMTGGKIHDTALFTKGTTELTQGIVDILNSRNADIPTASAT